MKSSASAAHSQSSGRSDRSGTLETCSEWSTVATIGYHASHEQYPPGLLLRHVRRAEEAGFQSAMCSDHIAPWSDRQGESGFAWSWLGAALQATDLPFGVVTAPVGWR